MTDDPRNDPSGESRQRWVSEVQEALDRTGDAVRTAWEATRDSRMSAMESAKQAAKELGDVIDKGMTAAKERWSAAEEVGDEAPKDEWVAEKPPTFGDDLDSNPDDRSSDQPG